MAVCHQFEGDRAAVREQTCVNALQHLTDYLDK